MADITTVPEATTAGAADEACQTESTARIHEVVKYPDPVLQRRGEPVTEFGPELETLVEEMFASMYHAHGIGLAAPQIGLSKRLTVIDVSFKADPEAKLVLINPEIVYREGGQYEEEGCLSLPEIRERVKRAAKVRVRYQDVRGEWREAEGEGLLSRAMQHEIDHLDGILFIQRLSALKRDLVMRRIRKLMRNGEW